MRYFDPALDMDPQVNTILNTFQDRPFTREQAGAVWGVNTAKAKKMLYELRDRLANECPEGIQLEITRGAPAFGGGHRFEVPAY